MYGDSSAQIVIADSSFNACSAEVICMCEHAVTRSGVFSEATLFFVIQKDGGVVYGSSSSNITIRCSTITGSSADWVRWPLAAVCAYVMGVDASSDVLTCVWVRSIGRRCGVWLLLLHHRHLRKHDHRQQR